MFAYLEGKLIEKHPTTAILDVGGIGYEAVIPLLTFHHLPPLGEKVRLLTYFHVREDLQQIFGFLTEEERSLFKLLLTVSGIGPKMAITVLSGLSPAELIQAINQQNIAPFTSISGIGRKTAERILLELKDKTPVSSEKGKTVGVIGRISREGLEDALLALISLGYKKANAEKAIQKVLEKDKTLSIESLIRESLKTI